LHHRIRSTGRLQVALPISQISFGIFLANEFNDCRKQKPFVAGAPEIVAAGAQGTSVPGEHSFTARALVIGRQSSSLFARSTSGEAGSFHAVEMMSAIYLLLFEVSQKPGRNRAKYPG
jgi:hypothetical protein